MYSLITILHNSPLPLISTPVEKNYVKDHKISLMLIYKNNSIVMT